MKIIIVRDAKLHIIPEMTNKKSEKTQADSLWG